MQKKLEKIENWQEKSLEELLREAQKVYMRRDEEKQKTQARVLVATVREAHKQERAQKSGKSTQARKPQGKLGPSKKKDKQVKCP